MKLAGLTNAAKLLGCKRMDLKAALSTRKIHAGSDHIMQKLTLVQVLSPSDFYIKFILGAINIDLFWVHFQV